MTREVHFSYGLYSALVIRLSARLARDMDLPTDIVYGPQEEIERIGPTDTEKLKIEQETSDRPLHYLIDEQRSGDAVTVRME